MAVYMTYAMAVTANLVACVSKNAPIAPVLEFFGFEAPKKTTISQKMAEFPCGITMPTWKDRKLSNEIEEISSAGIGYREILATTAKKFEAAIQRAFPDVKIWLTGSYAAGIDLLTSDLDFSLKIPSLGEKDQFVRLMAIKAKLSQFAIYKDLFVVKGAVPVLKMVDAETNVEIDVSIDNDAPKRNTLLLSLYGQVDARFSKLCRAVKKWASDTGVENSKSGRVNSFTICLLLVHYLQRVKVLPNLQSIFPELNGLFELELFDGRNIKEEIRLKGFQIGQDGNSLGALYWGFMKYYAQFNFSKQWISVKRGMALEKKRDAENNPLEGLPIHNWLIVTEDPFLETPFNCGRTLRQCDIFDRIVEEFHIAEKTIRKNHKICQKKTIQRTKIDDEGINRDAETAEIEVTLDRIFWKDSSLMKGRKDRMYPGFFYDRKDESIRKWPDVMGYA